MTIKKQIEQALGTELTPRTEKGIASRTDGVSLGTYKNIFSKTIDVDGARYEPNTKESLTAIGNEYRESSIVFNADDELSVLPENYIIWATTLHTDSSTSTPLHTNEDYYGANQHVMRLFNSDGERIGGNVISFLSMVHRVRTFTQDVLVGYESYSEADTRDRFPMIASLSTPSVDDPVTLTKIFDSELLFTNIHQTYQFILAGQGGNRVRNQLYHFISPIYCIHRPVGLRKIKTISFQTLLPGTDTKTLRETFPTRNGVLNADVVNGVRHPLFPDEHMLLEGKKIDSPVVKMNWTLR